MGNKIPNLKSQVSSVSGIERSLFNYTVETLDGAKTPLSAYNHYKSILVTNVASKCGLTKAQYEGLVRLRKEVRETEGDQSFEILAFPCSQFANQEPGTPEEIKAFVQRFNVEFPLFQKVNVNGAETHPVFQYLKYHCPPFRVTRSDPNATTVTLKAIGWNFGKFLLDGQGHVVDYFGPSMNPIDCKETVLKVVRGELHGTTIDSPSEKDGVPTYPVIEHEEGPHDTSEKETCQRS